MDRDSTTEAHERTVSGALLDSVRDEVERLLDRGVRPDPATWTSRFPDHAEEIESLVELRIFLREEGLEAGDGDDEDSREDLVLARIQGELQDAVNRGQVPDVTSYEARHPALAARIEEMARTLDFVNDALTGEHLSAPARAAADRGALGRYRIRHRIVDHPAGPVYLGEDGAGRRVELLILRPMIAEEAGRAILREAEHARTLHHEGVIPVLDAGEVRGVRYVAWEHRSGVSLHEALLEVAFHGGTRRIGQVLPPNGHRVDVIQSAEDLREARAAAPAAAACLATDRKHLLAVVRLVRQVAQILAEAHKSGFLHLDLRPEGVVVDGFGRPHLRWFGVGRFSRSRMVEEGSVPAFRSPEQAFEGMAPIDWRADVYRAGALLYTLLRLEPPYRIAREGPSLRELFVAGPTPLGELLPALPTELVACVEAAMAAGLDERLASCEVLAARLSALETALEAARVQEPETPVAAAVIPAPASARRGPFGLLRRLRGKR